MSLNQNFPIANTPIVDPKDGTPTLVFLAWMRTLFLRTGGEIGVSADELELLAILAQGNSERADVQARGVAEAAFLAALFRPKAKTDLTEAFLFSLANAAQGRTPKPPGYVLPASEAIAGGDLLNIYVNAGVMTQRKADASDPTKFCNAFSLSATGNGLTGPVQFAGFNDKVAVGSGASEVWLSDVTPGAFTASPPTTSGHLLQTVGTAVLGLGLAFAQGTYTIL